MFTNRYQDIIYQVFLQSPKVRREVTPDKGLKARAHDAISVGGFMV